MTESKNLINQQLKNSKDKIKLRLKKYAKLGLHYGHLKKDWNAKMVRYLNVSLFKADPKKHYIKLTTTDQQLQKARLYLRKARSEGKIILFVGTKKRISKIVRKRALSCGSFYINYRWLGGMLTNWRTIRKRIRRLRVLEMLEKYRILNYYPKKESSRLRRELSRLKIYLEGIKKMSYLPDVVVFVDQKHEMTAIKECRKLQIPTISLIDSNCDPDLCEIAIPGNDDSLRGIDYILYRLAQAIKPTKLSGQVTKPTIN